MELRKQNRRDYLIYNMKKLYCCYSVSLRNFLYQNGIKYEICAVNPNSQAMFWVYMRNEKLDKLLTIWSNEKR